MQREGSGGRGGRLTERGETVAGRCSVTEAGAERAGSGTGNGNGGPGRAQAAVRWRAPTVTSRAVSGDGGEAEGGLGRRR